MKAFTGLLDRAGNGGRGYVIMPRYQQVLQCRFLLVSMQFPFNSTDYATSRKIIPNENYNSLWNFRIFITNVT